MTPASAPQPEPQDRIGGLGNDPQVVSLAAGTQDPPVDTKTTAVDRGSEESGKLDSLTAIPKRGRPKTITDMKAYKAAKEREYRKRKALAKAKSTA